jgi:hypothetical protein
MYGTAITAVKERKKKQLKMSHENRERSEHCLVIVLKQRIN